MKTVPERKKKKKHQSVDAIVNLYIYIFLEGCLDWPGSSSQKKYHLILEELVRI